MNCSNFDYLKSLPPPDPRRPYLRNERNLETEQSQMARIHIRLVDDLIKLDLHLGALPSKSDHAVIIQIDTDIKNNGTFYTDSNGL